MRARQSTAVAPWGGHEHCARGGAHARVESDDGPRAERARGALKLDEAEQRKSSKRWPRTSTDPISGPNGKRRSSGASRRSMPETWRRRRRTRSSRGSSASLGVAEAPHFTQKPSANWKKALTGTNVSGTGSGANSWPRSEPRSTGSSRPPSAILSFMERDVLSWAASRTSSSTWRVRDI